MALFDWSLTYHSRTQCYLYLLIFVPSIQGFYIQLQLSPGNIAHCTFSEHSIKRIIFICVNVIVFIVQRRLNVDMKNIKIQLERLNVFFSIKSVCPFRYLHCLWKKNKKIIKSKKQQQNNIFVFLTENLNMIWTIRPHMYTAKAWYEYYVRKACKSRLKNNEK